MCGYAFCRLQKVVSEAKQKIKYQAAVISEQCIQLYGNRHALAGELDQLQNTISPASNGVSQAQSSSTSNGALPTAPPDHASNHTSDHTSSRPPDHTCVTLFDSPSLVAHSGNIEPASLNNDETVLPGPDILRSLSIETVGVEGMEEEVLEAGSQNEESSPQGSSTPPPPQTDKVVKLQHVTYSHASSSAEQVLEGPKSSPIAKPSLSRRGRKVLYKTLNKPTTLLIPARDSRSPESSSPTSPSLLTSQSSSLSSAESVTMGTISKESERCDVEDGDQESTTSEHEEDPMSCSMFATAPGYSTLATTHIHGEDEGVNGGGLDSPTKHSADYTDVNCLPQTPWTPLKERGAAGSFANHRTSELVSPPPDAVSVIPITPGIKSVESIKSSTAPKQPPVPALPDLQKPHNGTEQTNGVKSSGTESMSRGENMSKEVEKVLSKEKPPLTNGNEPKVSVSKTKKMAAATAGGDAVKHRYQRRGYRLQGVAGASRKRGREDGLPVNSSERAVEKRKEQEEEDVILVRMEARKQSRPEMEEYSINR